ncbi:hypothetical protein [Litoribacillus peritrichatus]|uniref:Lipoprotein n=1 Tax=Litoribacillus peritrichatus TaxID=718191 RepID=A0ABP7N4I6_9GAMM
MKKKPLICFITLAVLLILQGCFGETKLESLQKDATAFCEVHNLNSWQEFFSQQPAGINEVDSGLYDELDSRIEKVIKTSEFSEVITELNQVQWRKQLYPTVAEKISKLIKEDWECSHYEEFYSIKAEKVSNFKQAETLSIEISGEGLISISLATPQQVEMTELYDSLKQVLREQVISSVNINPHKTISAKTIAELMKTVGKLGINNVNLKAEDEQLAELQNLLSQE